MGVPAKTLNVHTAADGKDGNTKKKSNKNWPMSAVTLSLTPEEFQIRISTSGRTVNGSYKSTRRKVGGRMRQSAKLIRSWESPSNGSSKSSRPNPNSSFRTVHCGFVI